MFEKRINEIKQKTEEKFTEYQANSDEILYNVSLNEAIQEKTKSDMIRGIIKFVIILVLSTPLVWYFGAIGAIFACLYILRLLYLLVIGDKIGSKIKNPYDSRSFKPELKSIKKGK